LKTVPTTASVGERLGEQLLQTVLRRLEEDRLVLPPLSKIATKALDLVKTETNPSKVTELLEVEPVLALRVIRVGGSLRGSPMPTIQGAVTALGPRTLRSTIVEACVTGVPESRDRSIADATKLLWQHCVAVAMLARDLGTMLGVGDPEEAYLAGLLHDVGKLALAILLLEAEKQAMARLSARTWLNAEQWVEVLQRFHRPAGVALAKKWMLPPPIISVIEDGTDYDSGERNSVANVVRFSNALAKQQDVYLGVYDADDADAMVMIGRSLLGIEDDTLMRLVNGIAEKSQKRLGQ
jgi:putative nucleotidyltransferase with HDIG domain